MYAANSNSCNQIIFSDGNDSEVITTNINSSSSEAVNFKTSHQQNDINQTLDLSQDFMSVNQSYLPSEMMHHSQHHSHGLKIQVYDASGVSSLQPIMTQKYADYSSHHINEDGHILGTNDDSEGEFEEINELKSPSSKHVKRNLPHKKRIAKKLNSNQPYANEYSLMIPNVPVVTVPNYECNICGAGLSDQLQFFVHLKGHYEPSQNQIEAKHKEVEEMVMMDHRQHQHPENSQEDIKVEEIPANVMDEFNEFSEPEDLMEDLRKEVEKVVETIADNDCDQQQWTYQETDEIEEDGNQPNDDLQLYSENLIQSNQNSIESEQFEENDNSENHVGHETMETEEDDDDLPLEQVKQSMQKVMVKLEPDIRKFPVEDDREDLELTECLKKIHNFKCSHLACGKAFNSRTALGYHLKTHTTERRYVCDQCGKKFLTNGALKVHQRLHTDDRPYECKFPGCGKQWGDLKYHETSIHSNKKDHVCEFCAKAFARKYSLVIHRRIHTGERNYKCLDCGKSFRASSYLLNHKRIHTGEKPYCCSVSSCQKKFRVVGDLKRHMKIHERSKTATPKDKKKEVILSNIKIEAPAILNVNELNIDECVDLSFKEEDRNLVYSNNQIEIYTKSVNNEKEETTKKSRKVTKSRKTK